MTKYKLYQIFLFLSGRKKIYAQTFPKSWLAHVPVHVECENLCRSRTDLEKLQKYLINNSYVT